MMVVLKSLIHTFDMTTFENNLVGKFFCTYDCKKDIQKSLKILGVEKFVAK